MCRRASDLEGMSGRLLKGIPFTYLGSVLSSDGEVMEDVKCRIAKASRAFGCLRASIFNNLNLSVPTKRGVYRATVMSVLMYRHGR